MKTRIVPAALAALLAACLLAQAGQSPTTDYVRLTLAPSGPASVAGGPIPVSLVLENTSGRELRYVFQERDVQGKPLPYPADLTVRVTNAAGEVVTSNSTSRDDWWSWYYTWPAVTLVQKSSKKDRVKLKAGGRIERTIDLGTMMTGLDPIAGRLPAGTYTVQVALGPVRSNEITVEVAPSRERRVEGNVP